MGILVQFMGGDKRLKPLSILKETLNSRVIVELKGSKEYRGILEGFDPHMNLVLKDVEEHINGALSRKFDVTIVRGDNVIYISP
jgi:small nuclear ribonucleoprotein